MAFEAQCQPSSRGFPSSTSAVSLTDEEFAAAKALLE
jgi:hypothetical protein